MALLALTALLGACVKPPERPNVLLITVDTLRADRLSHLGYPRETTPNLDALAAQGVSFTRATTPRAKTSPAMASMMTGLYPHEHGVRDLSKPLNKRVPLLAERFKKAGYDTVGLIGNYVLKAERAGLDRGFRTWIEDLPQTMGVPPDHVPQRTASSLTDAALAALGLAPGDIETGVTTPAVRVEDGRPWFTWVHYMDPHGLYEPPIEYDRFNGPMQALPRPQELPRAGRLRPHVAEYNVPEEAWLLDGGFDLDRVIARYDGEVRFADAEIGRLMEALDTAGWDQNTIVVVSADHGESLGEHQYYFEHGRYSYEATSRIPLIVKLPPSLGGEPLTGLSDADISLVDLAPTLLELAGLEPLFPRNNDGLRGRSRADLWRGAVERGQGAPIYYEKVERADLALALQIKGVRRGPWKLLRTYTQDQPDADGSRRMRMIDEELYQLDLDGAETNNLMARPGAEGAEALEDLRLDLDAFFEADDSFADQAYLLQRQRENLERTDPKVLKQLENLGY
ncbi:MAG: sulfatase [Planctomycetota bacterium]